MNYIVFDLEATCWNDQAMRDLNQSEIIEIGAVKVNDSLEVVSEFQVYIKPILHKQLSSFCTELTGITQETVDAGVSFGEALQQFKNWIGNDDYYLCSWGNYDKNQFIKDCRLHRQNTDWLAKHTSVKHQFMEMDIFKQSEVYAKFMKKRGRVSAGMPTTMKILKLEQTGRHHSGIDDAKNIAKIFIKIFPNLKFE